jgi:hypothetical protein
MPYRLIAPPPLQEYPDLVDALAEELRLQRPDGPEDAPYIIEEQSSFHDFLHVRVLWDRWQGIPGEDRSRVIMDAYDKVRGTQTVLKMNSVLGLTLPEARKLGVADALLHAA